MKRYVSALAVALCLVSFKANAASTQHEVLINGGFGTNATLSIGGGESFLVNAGYLYSLGDMFQIGANLGGGYAGGSEVINLAVLANINFMMNNGALHSMFIGGGAGWDNITKGARQFAWRVDGGIRYKLFENVTWRPTVGVQDRGAGVKFVAEVLSMSLVF